MRRQENADSGNADRVTHDGMRALVANLAISAAKEQQRLAFMGSFGLLDLAEVNRMVAAVDRNCHLAFEISERAVEDRCAVRADLVTYAFELLAAADRKPARQRLLVRGKYVNGEDFALLEARIAVGLFVDAHQRQRWNQRDGSESVGGQPMQFAGGANRRNHGNAGCEMTHHAPQFVLFDCHPNLSARGCYQTLANRKSVSGAGRGARLPFPS